jgi:hypothetical protein
MPREDIEKPIILTQEMLDAMPDSASKRLAPGSKDRLRKEFKEFVRDMKYESLMGSKAFRAYAFEFFVGGWGAKTRAVKRKARARERNEK